MKTNYIRPFSTGYATRVKETSALYLQNSKSSSAEFCIAERIKNRSWYEDNLIKKDK